MPAKNVSWPQKPLFSPQSPPLSQAEARQRLRVIAMLGGVDEELAKMDLNRRMLVERLQQVPENN